MAKRKRARIDTRVTPVSRPDSISRLLSLPQEIRYLNWEAVVADPILVGVKARRGAPMQVMDVWSVALGPEWASQRCDKWHCPARHKKKTRGTGPLSWLRTNRQIYNEAQSVLYDNMSFLICDPIVLETILSDQLPKSSLKPETISSLSFCQKLLIEHDRGDGFTFMKGPLSHSNLYWMWCFAWKRLPEDGETLDKRMIMHKEVRIRMYFSCQGGNDRLVIGHFKDGGPKKGVLYRPRDARLLVCQDDEESVGEVGKALCEKMPLNMFKSGSEKYVQVQIHLDSIHHNDQNKCGHPCDVCWCKKREIDGDIFPGTALTSAVRRHLLSTN
ncbi:hypothetical protein N7520_011077 [Penicillium odoratum]|uniref:uncharacterized protein n=1 Tax=Penicillium odoratum TaxID=1167516 RepID=UPI002547FF7E|nr:uncharacterized protein N7520_011077 [Penicillium odoratum]KAJ5745895.1 hypothetical protein N7520_011077 [Penicillium odoratum]